MAGSILEWTLAHSGMESLGLGGTEQALTTILGLLACGGWAASARLFLPPDSASVSVGEVDSHTYLPGDTEAPSRT